MASNMATSRKSLRGPRFRVRLNKEDVRTKYELKYLMGEGSTSKVYFGGHKRSGGLVAIKCISTRPAEGEPQYTTNEIEALQKIRHPNIVRLFEVFDSPNELCLVMDLATGGELFDRLLELAKFSEIDASYIVSQVLDAVTYLHDIGIVHNDINPANILYKTADEDSKIILSDFGLAKTNVVGNTLTTACGSRTHIAPEIVMQQPYGSAVDVWSIGIITHTLLCGYPPFYAENKEELFKKIEKAEFDFASPYWDDISNAAKLFIRKLLDKDPKKRYTSRQAMQDPWICGAAASTKNIHETVSSNLKKNN